MLDRILDNLSRLVLYLRKLFSVQIHGGSSLELFDVSKKPSGDDKGSNLRHIDDYREVQIDVNIEAALAHDRAGYDSNAVGNVGLERGGKNVAVRGEAKCGHSI